VVQTIDRATTVYVERNADHRRSRTAMQAEHMVIAAGGAKIARVVSRRDGRKSPYRLIEAARLLEIAGNEFDAAHAADETGCHCDSPRPL